MVAYSFKKQFGPPILAGTKAQTIRADRKRHARPGEELQLYTGMRTKHCKLVARARCLDVTPIQMRFGLTWCVGIWLDGRPMASALFDVFARADGFADMEAMRRFWWAEHPPEDINVLDFKGVLIRWTPLAPADALDIGAAA
jgi:hypothetical protein